MQIGEQRTRRREVVDEVEKACRSADFGGVGLSDDLDLAVTGRDR
jgi:hypothetical protein